MYLQNDKCGVDCLKCPPLPDGLSFRQLNYMRSSAVKEDSKHWKEAARLLIKQ